LITTNTLLLKIWYLLSHFVVSQHKSFAQINFQAEHKIRARGFRKTAISYRNIYSGFSSIVHSETVLEGVE